MKSNNKVKTALPLLNHNTRNSKSVFVTMDKAPDDDFQNVNKIEYAEIV